MDAIRLDIPDRMPVFTSISYFAARYAGIPCSAAYYDFDAWYAAYEKTLAGFAKFPRLSDLESGAIALHLMADAFLDPEIARSMEILLEAGKELNKWKEKRKKFDQMILDLGFPPMFHGAAMPPFDVISNGLRGLKGTVMDIYRQPDKIIAACDKILELTLARPLPPPGENGNIRVFMTNTRGSDEFLSKEQFDRFYWPTFKTLVNTLVERGGTPCIFFEGNFTSRLEYLLEFPKGKVLVRFDSTDTFRAKDILRRHLCIEGNVPSSLLQTGTPDDVKEYCKKLIDYCGNDGGYILSPRSSTDEVKPENLKAMIEFTKEYGVY